MQQSQAQWLAEQLKELVVPGWPLRPMPSRSDISAATAIVPAASGRRASIELRLGNEGPMQRLRFLFEDVALSRWDAEAARGLGYGGRRRVLHRGWYTIPRAWTSPTAAG